MAEILDLITSAEVNLVSSDWHRPAVTTVPMATIETDVALLSDSDDSTYIEYGGNFPTVALVTLIGYLDPVVLPVGDFEIFAHVRYSVEDADVDDVAVAVTPTGPTFSLTLAGVGEIVEEDVNFSVPGDYAPGDYDLLVDAIEAGTATLRVGTHSTSGVALIHVYEAWITLVTPSGGYRPLVRVFPVHR